MMSRGLWNAVGVAIEKSIGICLVVLSRRW